ncbi:MAG: hypothetical protein ACRD8O_06705 [Bryobacteraceae bacterium]
MTDSELEVMLREHGYPDHVSRAGKAGIIARWKRFVEEVERGYELGLEDYRNDLDVRGIIALAGLSSEVADLDARFLAQLTARDRRVWDNAADPFWNFGYPKNASGELLEDLKAEGLA